MISDNFLKLIQIFLQTHYLHETWELNLRSEMYSQKVNDILTALNQHPMYDCSCGQYGNH